jgi:hypothetical protein
VVSLRIAFILFFVLTTFVVLLFFFLIVVWIRVNEDGGGYGTCREFERF